MINIKNVDKENDISVIITNFNKGFTIIEAINSVRNQIDRNDEIIFIDDCSSNQSSINAINDLETFKNFHFYQTPSNLGASGAKNYGISKANNGIIVLLDADDQIPENSLKYIKSTFLLNPCIDFLFGNYIEINLNLNSKKQINCNSIVGTNNLLDPFKLVENWKLLGTSPFRKSLYKKVGGFDQYYPRTDDIDFQRKVILRGAKGIYLNKTIYVWNKSSSGNNAMIPKEEIIFSLIRNFEFYYVYCKKINFLILLIKTFVKLFIFKFCKYKTIKLDV